MIRVAIICVCDQCKKEVSMGFKVAWPDDVLGEIEGKYYPLPKKWMSRGQFANGKTEYRNIFCSDKCFKEWYKEAYGQEYVDTGVWIA